MAFFILMRSAKKGEALALLKTFKKFEGGNDPLPCTKGLDKDPADVLLDQAA
jgi:hypothetical protein